MPWLSIAMWLISFFAAGGTKSGRAGKAALIATGVAAATYYAVDPANPDVLYDIFKDDAAKSVASTSATVAATTKAAGVTAGPGILDTTVRTAGSVLSSWGPSGTLGVVAGTTALTGSGVFSGIPKWVLIAGGGLLLLTVLKK